VGLEAAFEPDVYSPQVGATTTTHIHLMLGARVRPWYNPAGGYLAQPAEGHKFRAVDIFSDVWIDAHVGYVNGDANRVAYDVGAGVRVPIYAPFQAGIFVRFSQQFAIDNTADSPTFKQIAVGVEGSIGFLPVKPEPDSDGDGVPDARDRCPNTHKGEDVNDVGCPYLKEQKRAPAPTCSDTDLDGVCDGADECPDTPAGTKVDAHGCPVAEPPPDNPVNDALSPSK
jgi:hypothetical protein